MHARIVNQAKGEERVAEDEMVGWLHQFNEPELEQIAGGGEGQGNPVCCSPWGCKELDMTWRLNNEQGHSQLTSNIVTVSGEQQRDSAICIHVPFSSKLPFHPGGHITLSRVPCAVQ